MQEVLPADRQGATVRHAASFLIARRLLAVWVLAGAWTMFPSLVHADMTSLSGAQEILSLPYTINAPGVYYLSQNFTVSTTDVNAITVTTSGVTIDLNGYTISNLPAGKGVVDTGIYAPNGARLTIRNGTIRGFTYGIYLGNPSDSGDLIENVRLLDNTYAGICVYAAGSIVRHCQVFRVGGSTQPAYPNGVGILLLGSNNSVQDCDISELTTNTVHATIGVYADSAYSLLILNNRISGTQYGLYFGSGGSGKYRNNLCAASVTTPYTGGTDAGNN